MWVAVGRQNSLTVQWLGLYTRTAEGPGSILGWGTKIPQTMEHDQKEKKKKILCRHVINDGVITIGHMSIFWATWLFSYSWRFRWFPLFNILEKLVATSLTEPFLERSFPHLEHRLKRVGLGQGSIKSHNQNQDPGLLAKLALGWAERLRSLRPPSWWSQASRQVVKKAGQVGKDDEADGQRKWWEHNELSPAPEPSHATSGTTMPFSSSVNGRFPLVL